MQKKIFLAFMIFLLVMPAIAQEEFTEEFLFEEIPLVTIATQSPHGIYDAPAMVTVVTGDALKKMGIRNLGEYFHRIPGFGTSINYLGQMELEVRGIKTFSSEKIKFMVDGHTLNEPHTAAVAWSFSQLDIIPVEYIRQVEIIRGPGSALYGTSAFLGVVNVITKNPEEIDGFEVHASAGSFDFHKETAIFGKSWDEFGISGSFEYNKTNSDDLKVKSDGLGNPGKTQFPREVVDVNLKAKCHDFTLLLKRYEKEEGPYFGAGYILNDDTNQEYTQYFAEVNYEREVGEKLHLFTKVYYDYYDFDVFFEIMPEGAYSGFYADGAKVKCFYKDDNIGGEIRLGYQLLPQNHFTFGFIFERFKRHKLGWEGNVDLETYEPIPWYRRTGDHPLNWNKYNVTQEIWAVYFQDEWEDIIKGVNLTVGLRHDHYSICGSTTNPRVGINWSISDKADIKILYGMAFRAPSVEELYNINYGDLAGNPDLDPEIIQTYEAALFYRFAPAFKGSITYFHSKVEDLIKNTAKTYENIGDVTMDGIELEFDCKINNKFAFYLNYTFQEPEDDATNRELPDVARHKGNVGGNFELSQCLTLNANFYVCGKKKRAQGDPRNDLSSHKRLDTCLTLHDFFKNLEISVSVFNLLDEDYEDPSPDMSLTGTENDFPREGISGWLTARYRF